MSRVWTISLCHLDPPLMLASLFSYYQTARLKNFEHILCDHLYPIDHWNNRKLILSMAEAYNCKVITPYKNMGGSGGMNWVLSQIPIKDDDFVISFDPDSFPFTVGWDELLYVGMLDPSYGALSLTIDAEMRIKEWEEDMTSTGLRVKRPANGEVEMINVTMWRYSFLKACVGFDSGGTLYGFIEGPMHRNMKAMGLKSGYLVDAIEKPRPFNADSRYQQWKADYVSRRFIGTFDDYLKKAAVSGVQETKDVPKG